MRTTRTPAAAVAAAPLFEIECPSCGEDIVIDESILDIGEVTCPNCGDKFSMDLVDEAEAEDEDKE